MNNKKLTYSKLMTAIMLALFVVTLLISFGFMFYITYKGVGEVVDYVVCTTSITVVSGLLGVTMKYYFKKSSLENIAHIRQGMYKQVMDVRLDYDREVLKLRKKYNIGQDVIDEIEADAPFKEMSDAVIGQETTTLDSADSEGEAEPDETI